MANPTQKLYNRKANGEDKPIPSYGVKQMVQDFRYGSGTPKQKKLYYSLLNFCKENNLLSPYLLYRFERPRNFKDASSKINGMFSVIRKNNLLDKFKEVQDEHTD